jgi:hypothetical protein
MAFAGLMTMLGAGVAGHGTMSVTGAGHDVALSMVP